MWVIGAERPCRVMFNAMEGNRVVIWVKGHPADDTLEPTLSGEDKINKVGWDVLLPHDGMWTACRQNVDSMDY